MFEIRDALILICGNKIKKGRNKTIPIKCILRLQKPSIKAVVLVIFCLLMDLFIIKQDQHSDKSNVVLYYRQRTSWNGTCHLDLYRYRY